MDAGDNLRLLKLREGQLWKLEHGYVWIVELGERLIRYKMLRRPHAQAAITQMIRTEALLNYLWQTEAELVGGDERAVLGEIACGA